MTPEEREYIMNKPMDEITHEDPPHPDLQEDYNDPKFDSETDKMR